MKQISVGTVFLGVFWLLSTVYWALTLISWILELVGIMGILSASGLPTFGGDLYAVAVVELVILLLLLAIYLITKDKIIEKGWRKITALVVGLTCLPIIVFEIVTLFLLELTRID